MSDISKRLKVTDFEEGQWWLRELDAMVRFGEPDQKRAVAVVRSLMRVAHELAKEESGAVKAYLVVCDPKSSSIGRVGRLSAIVRATSLREAQAIFSHAIMLTECGSYKKPVATLMREKVLYDATNGRRLLKCQSD